MSEKINKKECSIIIKSLSKWLSVNSPMHYMYSSIYNELKNYENQLALMEEQNIRSLTNQVKTEYYKIIQ